MVERKGIEIFQQVTNGLRRGYNYDVDGRLTGVSAGNASLVRQSLTYAHDIGDRITKITNGIDANLTQTFGYDALSRLTTVAAPIGNEAIAYDANGNRTQYNWLANLTFAVEATSNRITDEHIVYGHDGRGNRSSQSWNGSTATYGYDAFNRLTSLSRTADSTYQNPGYQTMTYPAGTTNYTVNALGQRVGKSGPLGTSRFVYGGQTQLLAEHGGSWSSYLWLGGEAVGLVRGGQLYFLHGDHLARPEVVTDGAASTVWRARNLHSERGVITDAIGGLNLGFPGQYFDAESGLWYNGLRDGYDSRLGRYTQSDPIGLAGGLNTYAYVEADPVSFADPLGLMRWRGTSLTYGASWNGVGVMRQHLQLWSDCVAGSRTFVDITVSYGSLGKGLAIGRGGGGYVGQNISFEDDNGLMIADPAVFNGRASIKSGSAVPGVGIGLQKITIGSASTGWSLGVAFGFDVSGGVASGQSEVTSKVHRCGCRE